MNLLQRYERRRKWTTWFLWTVGILLAFLVVRCAETHTFIIGAPVIIVLVALAGFCMPASAATLQVTRKRRRSGERPRSIGGGNSEPLDARRVLRLGRRTQPPSPPYRRSKPRVKTRGFFYDLKSRLPSALVLCRFRVSNFAQSRQSTGHILGAWRASELRKKRCAKNGDIPILRFP
jgi:hypothetical protein